jgi:hypothetical protein
MPPNEKRPPGIGPLGVSWIDQVAGLALVLAGFAAALHSAVSPDEQATVEETGTFLGAYCEARGQRFSADEVQLSWAPVSGLGPMTPICQRAAGEAVVSLSKEEARERPRRAGIG